jgi:hypothetical protein
MSFLTAFVIGAAAALAAEFLPIHALRYTPRDEWPEWVTAKGFWTLTVVGVLIGGFIAGAYATGMSMTWYLAANVGVAWPSILNGLARSVPSFKPSSRSVD